MLLNTLDGYRRVQDAARSTLDRVIEFIKPGISEVDLVSKCAEIQTELGVDGYWYKSLPALVLVGNRTTLAISREPYEPSNTLTKETDLVTIDLNPSIDGYCGDYARTFYIEDGVAKRDPATNEEFIIGAHAEKHLHEVLKKLAYPHMAFEEIYEVMRIEIDKLGFEHLDYLGHGVQRDMNRLDFFTPGTTRTLEEAGFFTLEPQIRLKGGIYGFKHENIYYFQGACLKEL